MYYLQVGANFIVLAKYQEGDMDLVFNKMSPSASHYLQPPYTAFFCDKTTVNTYIEMYTIYVKA